MDNSNFAMDSDNSTTYSDQPDQDTFIISTARFFVRPGELAEILKEWVEPLKYQPHLQQACAALQEASFFIQKFIKEYDEKQEELRRLEAAKEIASRHQPSSSRKEQSSIKSHSSAEMNQTQRKLYQLKLLINSTTEPKKYNQSHSLASAGTSLFKTGFNFSVIDESCGTSQRSRQVYRRLTEAVYGVRYPRRGEIDMMFFKRTEWALQMERDTVQNDDKKWREWQQYLFTEEVYGQIQGDVDAKPEIHAVQYSVLESASSSKKTIGQ